MLHHFGKGCNQTNETFGVALVRKTVNVIPPLES